MKKKNARQKKFFLAGVLTFAVVAVVVYFFRSDGGGRIPRSSDEKVQVEQTFVCSDGREVVIRFRDGAADMRLPDGRLYSLSRTPSAGGARYANSKESMVLWSTEDSITVDEDGATVYAGCTNS